MKIAYIYYENLKRATREGGANVIQTLSTCSGLAQKAEVTFFHPWISDKAIEDCFKRSDIRRNFKVQKLIVLPLIYFPVLEQLGRLLFFFQLMRHLKKEKFDLLYTRDYSFLHFLNLFPSLKPDIPIFYEAHKVYHRASKKVKSEKEEKEAIEKNCSRIFTVTSYIERDLKAIGVNVPIFRLRNAVDLNLFKQTADKKEERRAFGIPANKTVILYIGSFLDWKGVDVFLEAAKASKDPDLYFMAVGGEKKSLKHYGHKFPGLPNVRLLESQPRQTVVRLLKASDIGILPTIITEGGLGELYTCPVKMLEYMAAGLPVIASDLPSIRDFLKEENAVFFRQSDYEDLLQKIRVLKSDSELAERIRKANLEMIKDYGLEKRAEFILEQYSQV